jgi:Protein of unknown function (DUF4242)
MADPKAVGRVVETAAGEGVTRVHSYVTDDARRTFCIYDGPSADAVRRVAERDGRPIAAITEVRVLDPNVSTGP